MRALIWGKSSHRDLAQLPKDVSRRIIAKMDVFCESGEGNVRHLGGRSGQLRLRDGDNRVVFVLTSTEIIVKKIGDRREVYLD